jgi:hypothetical protein
MEQEPNFVTAGDDAGEFYADSPKGVLRQQGTGGTSAGGDRAAEPPSDEITTHREVAYTDEHVHEAVFTMVDWLVGDGYNIRPPKIPGEGREAAPNSPAGRAAQGTGAGGDNGEIVQLRRLIQNSQFWRVFNDWVYYAIVDGHAFMELVVQDGVFKPRLLPTERMHRDLNQYNIPEGYILEPPNGGPDHEDAAQYAPHEVAELWFRKEPTDDFGRSFIEPVKESADILRDMEIDYARFIATKAYPPIIWKLGSEDEKWTEDQIQAWMSNIEEIEPDSMLFAPHDVDHDVVGTTSTSSTAGAMRLEETFNHFQDRIVTGLGVPALLMNMEGGGQGQGEAVSAMPAYKRRIRRLQHIIKETVEQQIFKSLLTESAGLETYQSMTPEFEFGEHSNAEERLSADQAIKLLNNGLLKPEAAARRAGIDPETELPDVWDSSDLLEVLSALAGSGDSIQNPDGGSPTDTGGGTESAGGEATTRQDPGSDSSDGRNRSAVTEDEDA